MGVPCCYQGGKEYHKSQQRLCNVLRSAAKQNAALRHMIRQDCFSIVKEECHSPVTDDRAQPLKKPVDV